MNKETNTKTVLLLGKTGSYLEQEDNEVVIIKRKISQHFDKAEKRDRKFLIHDGKERFVTCAKGKDCCATKQTHIETMQKKAYHVGSSLAVDNYRETWERI